MGLTAELKACLVNHLEQVGSGLGGSDHYTCRENDNNCILRKHCPLIIIYIFVFTILLLSVEVSLSEIPDPNSCSRAGCVCTVSVAFEKSIC